MGIFRITFLLFAALAPAFAGATSFMQIPFPQTISEAPAIVRGTVGNGYSDWGAGPDGNKRIYTYTELQVAEVFKGNVTGRNIVIREIGGSKDGMGLEIAGAAKFNRGEDIVVMLGDANPDGSRDVRGLMMGKLMVEKDAQGPEYLSGPALGLGPGDEHVVQGGQGDTGRWTLDALRREIQSQGTNSDKNSQHSVTGKVAAPPAVKPTPSLSPWAGGQAAPRLQPSPLGEGPGSTSTSRSWLPWLLAGLAAAGLLAAFRRRNRGR